MQAKTFLEGEGYVTEARNLSVEGRVPEDAAALVIAGPTRDFTKEEADAVQAYLEKGGKVFVALDPSGEKGDLLNLKGVLKNWGIGVNDDLVLDPGSHYLSLIHIWVLIINNGRLVASDTPQGLSERLEGRGRIAVRIRSPKGETESLIRRIPGVVSVFIEPDDAAADDKSILFVVETDGKTDVREDIFFAVAEQGSPIIEMRPIDMSLEDVFLKLTTEERLEDEREVASGA